MIAKNMGLRNIFFKQKYLHPIMKLSYALIEEDSN